jgi:hypothetical protein
VTLTLVRRTAAAIIAVALTSAPGAQSSLQGTALRPADDLESGLSDVITGLLGGRSDGALDKVIVEEDSGSRLVVSVSHSGFPNHRLSANVLGRDRRRQGEVQASPIDLPPTGGETRLTLELRRSPPDGVALESEYLNLVVLDARRSRIVSSRTYRLGKVWSSSASGSGPATTLRLTPKPIGAAAQLGPQPNYTAPPKEVVPVRVVDHRGAAGDRATVSPGVVRDHRDGSGTTATDRPRVRDHRTADTTRSGAVRDHRTGTAATGQPEVRDHRTQTPADRAWVAQKTQPALAKLPPSRATIVAIDRFKYGVKEEDARKGAEGPGATPIELLEGLRADDVELDPATLLNVSTSVYADKNPGSGVFYFHPRAYHLDWDAESGYGLRILYGAAASDATGNVLMAARLNAGVDQGEIQLAQDLLAAYVRRHPGTAYSGALRPLPLEKEGANVSIASVLGQYSIPADKIAITAISDVLGAIDVSWVTDPVTKENLQLALVEDVGLNGEVAFATAGGALAPQIPVEIRLADRGAFGRVRWQREDGWKNVTPYPVRLRYLHALCINPQTHLPVLYSWSLDNVEVGPSSRVHWDASGVPAWIDREAKRIWIDYSVVQTCAECDKAVLDAITGGVTSVTADEITFHTITPLADTSGYEITAQVRSRYFDPKVRTSQQKDVVLKSDNQDFRLGPIYAGGRDDGPLFEYLLELAMPDGTIHRGTRWIQSNSLRVLIGRSQLEQSLESLPAKPAGAPQ